MRRKHRRLRSDADLDITPFMNLMIVLVPVLLLNMVFAHTTVLELNFPNTSGSSAEEQQELQLQVMIFDDQLVVADNQGGVIKAIPLKEAAYDYETLGKVMQELKRRLPEKRNITIMPSSDTPYQALVSVMDSVRSYEAVVAGDVVNAELFPEISLGDAPERADRAEAEASS
ncbi:ExbD/TolR family protein [Marinobacter confluentis]|uniref:Biopolymer transporter ExbD n=1 Tax=Marinobacter confluentis TaxID=1697557 RepID=A0A4Z1C707_9GAMM|nr:biopolymer transporter ExbD [Marinobacter confluentis]TGN41390.1 biopolymer transporter ExbD [Marinobacter confluentis]